MKLEPEPSQFHRHRSIEESAFDLTFVRLPSGLMLGTFLLLLVLTLATTLSPSSAQAEGWTLAKNEDGIQIFTRPVPDSGIKEFKGETEFKSSVDSIMTILRDSARFKEWFPNTPSSKLLRAEGDSRLQYSTMATPWPISDRDNVLRIETEENATAGTVDISIAAAPDAHPEQSGHVRVKRAKGSWRLETLAPKRTRVIFTMHLEPGGGIPEWMINSRIVATPFEALTNLRAFAEN